MTKCDELSGNGFSNGSRCTKDKRSKTDTVMTDEFMEKSADRKSMRKKTGKREKGDV